MTFEEELMAGFGEVEKVAMPVEFTVSNRQGSGVVQRLVDETPMNEAGYEPKTSIIIVATRDQFASQPIEAPLAERREIVQIASGPYVGKWVLTDVKADLAHYHLICSFSE